MLRVSDEEDTLDSVERSSGQPLQGVDGGSSSLGVTLQVEAVGRVRGEGRGDLPDDVGGTSSRVLAEVGGVDRVVDLPARELRGDTRVDGSEPGRLPLNLTSTSGVDDSVTRASSGDSPLGEDGRGDAARDGAAESDDGGNELDHCGRL